MDNPSFSREEMMVIEAARQLNNDVVCFVGIGLPSVAANLARITHAPDIVLVYESGTIGAKPTVLPLSIGDGELADTADTVVSVPEVFAYWLQGGRIDIGFLGAAQIDKFGNINTTMIGTEYGSPQVRLPGAGGAPEIAACAKQTFLMLKQSPRSFVNKLDFITSAGYLEGGNSRKRLGAPGKGPTRIITDLGVLQPEPKTFEFQLTKLFPDVTVDEVRSATGWDLKVSSAIETVQPPTAQELKALRDLKKRTEKAHRRAT